MAKTKYGKKEKGSSKFVVVAPHAAGDDLRTKEIAEEISKHLNAYLIVNEKYIKPTNSRAGTHPHVEDFNKLSWSKTQEKYIWRKRNRQSGQLEDAKHPDMKEFYDHITEFAKEARQYGDDKAIVVYIHGMSDNPEQIGIDIGFGAKYHQGKLKGAMAKKKRDKHPDAGDNTGVIRASTKDMAKLKDTLEEKLLANNPDLKAGIGTQYAAWSKRDAVQFHKSPDHSFQLEISSLLRKKENVEYTAKLIADALKDVYNA